MATLPQKPETITDRLAHAARARFLRRSAGTMGLQRPINSVFVSAVRLSSGFGAASEDETGGGATRQQPPRDVLDPRLRGGGTLPAREDLGPGAQLPGGGQNGPDELHLRAHAGIVVAR